MRELDANEITSISGGIGPGGAILGGITGGVSSAVNGGSAGEIAQATLFGALAGFTGGLAAVTTGFVRAGWLARSVGLGAVGGADTN